MTMAAREASATINRPPAGPAVFTSKTTHRERARLRRAVVRAVERLAASVDPALDRMVSGLAGSEVTAVPPTDLPGIVWALNDGAGRALDLLGRTLAGLALPRTEIAAAEAVVADALAKMHRVLNRRFDRAWATASMTAHLVRGAVRRRDEVDERLRPLTGDWPAERQSAADRNVLRLAAYEVLFEPDTPVAVVLNEAVELAKRYGTDESSRFVNGVLAALVAAVAAASRREDVAAASCREDVAAASCREDGGEAAEHAA
jgi:N utilization substance protein B